MFLMEIYRLEIFRFDCKSCLAQSLGAQNVKHEITSINNICHGLWGVNFLPLNTAILLLGRVSEKVLEFKNFN
jgi:hypothetical protein